jgi:Ca-activated chloride channel family protein
MSRRLLLRLLQTLLVLVILLLHVPTRAQDNQTAQEPPADQEETSVELSANLVNIVVVVRDRSGALVTNLTPADFAVYEESTLQEVDQIFRQGEVPLRLALLFDASLSIKKRLDFEQRAASRFFTAVLKPGDQAALISVSNQWRLEQPLTDSAAALVGAMEKLEAKGTTALFGAIKGASEHLGTVEGRRVMVILSDGYDTSAKGTLRDALEFAQRSDVVIYAISPSGAGNATNATARIGAEALRQLCEDTGGVAFFPPVEVKPYREAAALDAIYNRLIEELRAQYVLTYYSKSPSGDGRYRTLRVEVKRPNVTVSARKGYYAK